ncbi:hypothetical protein GCM10023216_24560 [Isoptericola chiayiensis]|uniref:Uncharacterized protein n=1 Tax=Isoptericola chiayiensis TaxID=579446 RepID=A0ABP8YKT3_9MICO|nr:hypothetical protein [Isoptericola chiayiensis]NOW02358.1 hypothetical protein [Isoptericola chiayiensis]
MRTNLVRNLVAGLGASALALGVGLVAVPAAQADVGTPVGPVGGSDGGTVTDGEPAGNLPGVPEPGSAERVWVEWAAAERAEAEATDWEADAAARGCELQEVTITDEMDVAYNRAMGAPDDLATHRVEMVESCDGPDASGGMSLETDRGATTTAIGSGSDCDSTSGPGTICVYKSSGRIYGSWKYRGSGSASGFLRIYQIPTSSSGCYRGTTWLTGPSRTWSSGMTRSISKTRTSYSGYSAHIWKSVWHGHTDWGSTCSKL